jgi:hypothetical protein
LVATDTIVHRDLLIALARRWTSRLARPASANRKVDPPLMTGASWVRVVRPVPQRQARLWTGRTFHVKRWISRVHGAVRRRPRRCPTARREPLTSDSARAAAWAQLELADQRVEAAEVANQHPDDYVLLTVLAASVLFFSGIGV